MSEQVAIELTSAERERLAERLHLLLGFYVNPIIEDQFAEAVECIIEERLEPITALADDWQAEIEDSASNLASFDGVLGELRNALANPPAPEASAGVGEGVA